MPELLHIASNYWHFALLGLLMYLFNELEDECARNHWTGKFEKWNIDTSWANKWAAPWPQDYQKRWYHFGVYPKFKERFPYSTTLLVWRTDAEHFFQFCKFRCIEVALFMLAWEAAVLWVVGKSLMSFTKEKFLKSLK